MGWEGNNRKDQLSDKVNQRRSFFIQKVQDSRSNLV